MDFNPLTMRGADGTPITLDVAVLRVTDGCLGLQRCLTDDGATMYLAVHVPMGGFITNYGFYDADQARDCLVDFWTKLSDACRQQMQRENTDWLHNKLIGRTFDDAFVNKAPGYLDMTDAAKEVAGG